MYVDVCISKTKIQKLTFNTGKFRIYLHAGFIKIEYVSTHTVTFT